MSRKKINASFFRSTFSASPPPKKKQLPNERPPRGGSTLEFPKQRPLEVAVLSSDTYMCDNQNSDCRTNDIKVSGASERKKSASQWQWICFFFWGGWLLYISVLQDLFVCFFVFFCWDHKWMNDQEMSLWGLKWATVVRWVYGRERFEVTHIKNRGLGWFGHEQCFWHHGWLLNTQGLSQFIYYHEPPKPWKIKVLAT